MCVSIGALHDDGSRATAAQFALPGSARAAVSPRPAVNGRAWVRCRCDPHSEACARPAHPPEIPVAELAFLVQSHYRDPHARIDAVDLACALGAVRRLEGRLWKRSSQFPKYQERQVWVDDLQLKYSVRSGDPKTIDLAQIDQIVIHSEDRREFALCTRNGRSYTFRADTKESFEMWTTGLQQFMGMARAYYALS